MNRRKFVPRYKIGQNVSCTVLRFLAQSRADHFIGRGVHPCGRTFLEGKREHGPQSENNNVRIPPFCLHAWVNVPNSSKWDIATRPLTIFQDIFTMAVKTDAQLALVAAHTVIDYAMICYMTGTCELSISTASN